MNSTVASLQIGIQPVYDSDPRPCLHHSSHQLPYIVHQARFLDPSHPSLIACIHALQAQQARSKIVAAKKAPSVQVKPTPWTLD